MSHPNHSNAPGGPRAFDNTSKLVAIAIGVIAGIAGLVVGMVNPFMSQAASTQGVLIDALFGITLGLATAVFVIVQGFLLYSIIRFGREPGDETDAVPIRGNTRLEIFWTAVPAIVILFVGLLSYRVLADIERPNADQLTVEVTAQQYAWQYYYPEQDITTNELHIPQNRQVHLKLRSKDVIHSFWVPAFRIKKDVMPDRLTETYITGSELGTYPVVCTELCGAGHAVMRSQVVVESDANFQSWLASQGVAQAQAAEAAAADPFAAGKAAFNVYGCNACHALASAGAVGAIGPKLDGIGTRAGSTVAGQSAEEYIKTSILKPAAHLAPGFADLMPKDYEQRVTPTDLDALVKYLLEQK
jgi:cytochrome c oxidase subunit 2